MFPTTTGGNAFSVRWQAPELIYPEESGLHTCVRTKRSDIYALAMLMYEVRVNHVALCLATFG